MFFRKELVAVDDPEDPHDIARIEQAIAGQLSIVEIAAHPDDNVHRIFESLNHTGQPLTQADLLRNYLFMRLPNRAEHVYSPPMVATPAGVDDEAARRVSVA